jgi:glucan 1,3-beta-glucosidase
MVGRPGEVGSIEWSDTLVSTRGALCGAVLIQYNLFSPTTPSGMWDVHTRIGGFPGTDLQLLQCPAIKHTDIVNENCVAAFLSMHITVSAGGLFTENCWLWVADHDLEDQQYRRVTIYAGRGLLVESQRGRIWLSATGAEHHVLYQYQLANTRDIYMGHVQTESPYFQPLPLARYPFPPIAAIRDPDFLVQCEGKAGGEPCETAWGMRVLDSENIAVHGAGFYSFFDSYSDGCSRRNSTRDCQQRLVSIHGTTENTKILGLSTVGAKVMVERNGLDLVPAAENNSSFADTLALYRI